MRRNAKSRTSSYPGAHLLVIAAFWTSAPGLEAQIFVFNQEAPVAVEMQPEQNGKLTYAHTAATAEGEPEGFSARHGMIGVEYQEEWNRRLEEGFLTTAVTGYRAGDQVFFAAIWRKP